MGEVKYLTTVNLGEAKYLSEYNPIETIKTFYFFDSRRWDIVTISNQLIKLPAANYEKSLKNFLGLKDHNNFYKYKVFDYRIQDQLILK